MNILDKLIRLTKKPYVTTLDSTDEIIVNSIEGNSKIIKQSDYAIQMTYTPPIDKYKIYTAQISQQVTNAPTVEILDNTIGDIVWTRANVGKYIGTLNGAFPDIKTNIFINTTVPGVQIQVYRVDNDVIEIDQADLTGLPIDELYTNFIEIRVYN